LQTLADSLGKAGTAKQTTPPPLNFAVSVANDISETGFSRQWAFAVWEAETLHCYWIAIIMELIAWN
jgi:hypothetical protein